MGFFSSVTKIFKKAAPIALGAATGGWGGAITAGLGSYFDYKGAKDVQDAYGQAARTADPFGPYRQMYGNKLAELYAKPESISTLPGYKFSLDQGLKAVDRRMSKGGYLKSGNRMMELTKYAQGLASQMYSSEANRLANLAGANVGNLGEAAGNIVAGAGAGTNATNTLLGGLTDIFKNIGSINTPPISSSTSSVGLGGIM